MAKKWGHRRDDAGSMLASVVIIVIGTGLCCFLCMTDSSEFSDYLMVGLPIAAMLFVGWLMLYRYGRNDASSMTFWYSAARNHREEGLASQYRPRKVKDGRENAPAGTNKPITAKEAHEIQTTSANTWVPAREKKRDG